MHRLGWLIPLALCACMNGAVVNLDAGGSTTDGDSGMPTPTDAGPVTGQGVYQHDVQDEDCVHNVVQHQTNNIHTAVATINLAELREG